MSKFHAGDEVIVTEGVRCCVYDTTEKMIGMIGSIVHISSADESSKFGIYKLSEDRGIYNWCDRCFELYIDENETSISDEEFDEILGSLLLGGDSDEV